MSETGIPDYQRNPPGTHRMAFYATLMIFILFFITSCNSGFFGPEKPIATDNTPNYDYTVGLGYGFLGKFVQVTIDENEVISIVGTDEIEQTAQLLGTKMLFSGSSPKKEITVRVTVDEDQPHEQIIDLSTGMYIHIYLEQTGLRIYNTRFLVQE